MFHAQVYSVIYQANCCRVENLFILYFTGSKVFQLHLGEFFYHKANIFYQVANIYGQIDPYCPSTKFWNTLMYKSILDS